MFDVYSVRSDRYDFATVVDAVFKECKSVEDMVSRYTQMRKDLDNLFRQNVALKGADNDCNEHGISEKTTEA